MVGNLVLRLENNADIMQSIKDFAIENKIKSGFFVSARGSIKNFELMVNGSRALLNKQKHDGIFDVNSVSGKIQLINNQVNVGLRVSVSSTGFTSQSGQLINGKAANFLEFELKDFNDSKMIIA